jgi:anti-sigma-K factor RskA
MSDDERDQDPHLATGSYSLNAMSSDEAARFERAAEDSANLRDEADSLVETAGILGLAAVPVEPSPELKADLMAKIRMTAQLPPQAGPDADAPSPAPTDSAAVSDRTAAETTVEPEPAGAEAAMTPSPLARSESPAMRKARARWFARPVAIVVAVAAAAALFVGGGFVGGALTSTTTTQTAAGSADQLVEIASAPDAQTAHAAVGGTTATVVWSGTLAQSAVVMNGLPSLPGDKVYEAWYINGSGATAAGTFTASGDGPTWHVLAGAMSAGDAIGVTVEPAGGSTQPTTSPVVVVQS